MQLEQHKSGMWVRPETFDSYIIAEVKRHYGWLDVKNKKVMDVGANIGAFSRWALDNGAREVLAFEPEEINFRLLRKNAPEARAIRAAVVSGDDREVTLYTTKSGKNPGNYSTVPFRGRDEVRVPAKKFEKALAWLQPQVIKLDCEGAEYDLLKTPLPDCVEQVAMEIHLQKKGFRELASRVCELFNDWECVKEPKWNDRSWTAQAGWRKLPGSTIRSL